VPGPHHRGMKPAFRLLNSLVQTMSLVVVLGSARPAEPSQRERACVESLALAAELPDLDLCRPAPASAAEKSLVLASLPAEGEVTSFTRRQREKLDRVRAALRVHARDAIYAVKVVDVGPMTTALVGRVVLLISRPALDFLDADELEALVAHEVGHEYVWDEFETAARVKNANRQRQLELVCDRIAAQTLLALGISPTRLTRGLERALGFNRARFDTSVNERRYPTLRERAEVIREVARRSPALIAGSTRGSSIPALAAAELDHPEVVRPAPELFSLSGRRASAVYFWVRR
jgi:hypothetical protein